MKIKIKYSHTASPGMVAASTWINRHFWSVGECLCAVGDNPTEARNKLLEQVKRHQKAPLPEPEIIEIDA